MQGETNIAAQLPHNSTLQEQAPYWHGFAKSDRYISPVQSEATRRVKRDKRE